MAIIAALPVTLANGTTADATQVMSDFNFVVSQVNANSAALAGGNVFAGTQVVPVSSARNQAPQTSQVQDSSFVYAVDSSITVNLLTLSLAPAIAAYVEGQSIKFKPANTNTGATTVNVNTVGVKNVFAFGAALVGGELVVGIESEMVYDGTQFGLITPSAFIGPVNKQGANIASAATVNLETSTGEYVHITGTTTITAITLSQGHSRVAVFDGALTLTNGASLILPGGASLATAPGDVAILSGEAAGVVRVISYTLASGQPVAPPRGYLAGFGMTAAGGTTSITWGAGQCADSLNAASLSLGSAITKTTAAWAVGSAAGGLDTGAIAASTAYHFYAIKRLDTGVVDVLFSQNVSAPTMPTNYTLKRLIGSWKTDGASNWVAGFSDGDLFTISTSVEDISTVNPGTAAVTRSMTSIPTGRRFRGIFQAQSRSTSNSATITGLLSDLSAVDEGLANDGSSAGNFWYGAFISGQASGAQVEVMTNTTQQIRTRIGFSDANVVLHIRTRGWYDDRGKNS